MYYIHILRVHRNGRYPYIWCYVYITIHIRVCIIYSIYSVRRYIGVLWVLLIMYGTHVHIMYIIYMATHNVVCCMYHITCMSQCTQLSVYSL